jgi:hypothetical protein
MTPWRPDCRKQFEQYLKLCQHSNIEQLLSTIKVDDIGRLADIICSNLVLSIEEKQELVEIFNPIERCKKLADIMDLELEKLHVDRSGPEPRQKADGACTEGVLPQREDQGDSEGAWQEGRKVGTRRAEAQD